MPFRGDPETLDAVVADVRESLRASRSANQTVIDSIHADIADAGSSIQLVSSIVENVSSSVQIISASGSVDVQLNGGGGSYVGTINLVEHGNITMSTAGGGGALSVSLSAGTQSQSTGPAAISASNKAFTSGTVVLTGAGIITVATSGTGTQQTIVLSATAPAGSTAPAAISASDTAFTSGTVVFSGSDAATVKTAGTGTQQTVLIDVPAQTVQTQGSMRLQVNGGATSSGVIVLSDSNGIGWGGNASTITASYSQSTHSHSTGPSAIIASDGTFTSGSVVFTGSGEVTVQTSGTGTQQTVVLNAPAQTAQTQSNLQAVVALSNTTGTTGSIQTGTFGLAGGNSITISQSSGTASTNLTIVGPTFSNSNNVSFGANGATITASASYSQSTAPGAISASDKAFTSGTVVLTGSGIATVQTSGTGTQQTIVINVPATADVDLSGIAAVGNTTGTMATLTAGTVGIAGGNSITISQSSGTASTNLTISGPQFSNSNNISFGANAGTITATASYSQSTAPGAISASNAAFTSGTVVLSGSEAVTVKTSGTGTQQTVLIDAPAQTAQTQSNIQALVPLGNTTGTTGSIQTGTVGLAGGGGITLSQSSGAASTNLSVIGNTFANSNGVSFGLNAGTVTASVAAASAISGISASNTDFTSGTVVLTGSDAVTVKTSGTGTQQTIVIDAPVQTAQTQSNLQAVVPLGNTLGTTGSIQTGTFGLAGGGIVSISQSSGTASTNLTISASQSVQTQSLFAAAVNGGGSSSGTVTLSNSNNVTFGGNASVITASASYSQSTAPAAISASNSAFTSGTVVISGGANITVGTSGTGTQQTITIAGGAAGGVAVVASDATYTSGTVVVTGVAGNVVVGSDTGQAVVVSEPFPTRLKWAMFARA